MSNTNVRDQSWLSGLRAAHRGLFTAGTEREENTLPAITAAIELGYAIEIDVQVTADKKIMVFHDFTLERLTGGHGRLADLLYSEIKQHIVGATKLPIPTLKEVLDTVNGQSPLLIEVKSKHEQDIRPICEGVREFVQGYKGHVAIMSFDPRIISWFRKHAPDIIRGWVISKEALDGFKANLMRPYIMWQSKPDFIACDIRELPNSFTAKWRSHGNPLLTWTVRTQEQEKIGIKHTDGLIFEAPAVVGESVK